MLRRAASSERSARRLGIAAVWVATFAWAWGYILVKWSSVDGLHFAMFRLWTGAVISCIALLGTRRRVTRATFRACALGGVGVALVPGFVGHTLVIWSHRHVDSWLSALITQSSPVITVTLAWVLLGEALPPLAIVGGAIVLVATGVVLVAAARKDTRADLDE